MESMLTDGGLVYAMQGKTVAQSEFTRGETL